MLSTRARQILSSSALVAVGLGVAQFLSYLLNIAAARILGPIEFGAFAALMSVILIVSTVALGLQAAISKRVVATEAPVRQAQSAGLLAFAARIAVALALVAAVASPLVSLGLRLDSLLAAVLAAVIMGLGTLGGGQLGIAQGAERFGRLGSLYSSVQLARTVCAVAGALVAGTLTGTMLGLAVGTAIGVAVGQLLIRPLVASPSLPTPGIAAETWHAAQALLALFVLTNMDILLARYFLPAETAGIYAVGVLIAKVAFFLPQFVIVIAFPAIARRQDRRSVFAAAGVTASIGLVVTAIVAAAGPLVVAAVGGSQYAELNSEAWLFAAEGALFAVAQVMLYGLVAHGNRWATAFLWVAVVVLGLAVALGPHDSVQAIVLTALAVSAAVVAAGVVVTARARPRPDLTDAELDEFIE